MKKRNIKTKAFIIILILVSLLLSSCTLLEELDEILEIEGSASTATMQGDLAVHFIDVGQGDSILIQSPSGQNMLIDAGDNHKGGKVVEYLESQGVSRIDFLVGTHPHADHIGGLDDVIYNFDIGQIYMPKVTHTTKTYEDVLKAVQSEGLKIKATYSGTNIPFEGVEAEVLAPDRELKSDNLNDYSIIITITHGETMFLFQGDAEKATEDGILESGAKIKADVIKLGHHGSSTSNTQPFIEAVDPDYAVITLGEDNRYGHPHKEVMELMDEKGISVYRTDMDGDILVISDGEEVSFVE